VRVSLSIYLSIDKPSRTRPDIYLALVPSARRPLQIEKVGRRGDTHLYIYIYIYVYKQCTRGNIIWLDCTEAFVATGTNVKRFVSFDLRASHACNAIPAGGGDDGGAERDADRRGGRPSSTCHNFVDPSPSVSPAGPGHRSARSALLDFKTRHLRAGASGAPYGRNSISNSDPAIGKHGRRTINRRRLIGGSRVMIKGNDKGRGAGRERKGNGKSASPFAGRNGDPFRVGDDDDDGARGLTIPFAGCLMRQSGGVIKCQTNAERESRSGRLPIHGRGTVGVPLNAATMLAQAITLYKHGPPRAGRASSSHSRN